MSDNRNTLTDEILVLAETLGDIKARFERVESEFAIQSRPLDAALVALSAAMTGIKTLQNHVLDNSLSALSIKVEEQRKAIDEQITSIASELKNADAQNSEKVALQTAELKQQFAEICSSVQQLSSQFDAQIKRVEFEAKEQMTKFAAVAGPQGPAGASLNPRGNWVDGVVYNRLDVVSLLGTSYISAVDENATKPSRNSEKWTVLSQAGTGGGGAANFGSLAGVAEINQGGTGQTTAIAGARALLDGISTTRGTVLYRGSDGWTALNPGAADTVLKSQGTGADPQWAATSSATAATDAQAAAGTSTTTFITPANGKYAAAPVVNGRAPRQGLVFDGTTGASIGNSTAFGTSDFTIAAVVNGTSFSTVPRVFGGAVNSFVLLVSTGGNLQTSLQSIADNTQSTGTLTAGKISLIVYTRSGTTGTYYIDGVAAGTTTDSRNYSAATTFLGATLSLTTVPFPGTISNPLFYNRALSAAEVVALYEAGAPSAGDYQTAGQKNISAFEQTVIPYTSFSGASATGFTAVKSSGSAAVQSGNSFTVIIGSGATKVRVTGTLALNNGKTVIPTALIAATDGTTLSSSVTLGAAGTFSVNLTATVASSIARVWFVTSGDADYTISNAKVEVLGLLLAPDAAQAGGGLVWYDTSGNAANITLPASGVSWNVPSSRVLGGNWTTSGNLTVSGTGTSSVAGNWLVGTTTDNSATFAVNRTGTGPANSGAISTAALRAVDVTGDLALDIGVNSGVSPYPGWIQVHGRTNQATNYPLALNPNGGNVLLGTTTDGGQKLQVAGTAYVSNLLTAAGASISGSNAPASGASVEINYGQIANSGRIFAYDRTGSAFKDIYIDGSTVTLRSGSSATTALTLESSSNATFAGKVTVSGAGTSDTLSYNLLLGGTKRLILGYDSTNDYGLISAIDSGTAWKNLVVNPIGGALLIGMTASTGEKLQAAGSATFNGYAGIADGMTAPSATTGYAKIYVDSADGDLKVIFGDGTVKTIVTD